MSAMTVAAAIESLGLYVGKQCQRLQHCCLDSVLKMMSNGDVQGDDEFRTYISDFEGYLHNIGGEARQLASPDGASSEAMTSSVENYEDSSTWHREEYSQDLQCDDVHGKDPSVQQEDQLEPSNNELCVDHNEYSGAADQQCTYDQQDHRPTDDVNLGDVTQYDADQSQINDVAYTIDQSHDETTRDDAQPAKFHDVIHNADQYYNNVTHYDDDQSNCDDVSRAEDFSCNGVTHDDAYLAQSDDATQNNEPYYNDVTNYDVAHPGSDDVTQVDHLPADVTHDDEHQLLHFKDVTDNAEVYNNEVTRYDADQSISNDVTQGADQSDIDENDDNNDTEQEGQYEINDTFNDKQISNYDNYYEDQQDHPYQDQSHQYAVTDNDERQTGSSDDHHGDVQPTSPANFNGVRHTDQYSDDNDVSNYNAANETQYYEEQSTRQTDTMTASRDDDVVESAYHSEESISDIAHVQSNDQHQHRQVKFAVEDMTVDADLQDEGSSDEIENTQKYSGRRQEYHSEIKESRAYNNGDDDAEQPNNEDHVPAERGRIKVLLAQWRQFEQDRARSSDRSTSRGSGHARSRSCGPASRTRQHVTNIYENRCNDDTATEMNNGGRGSRWNDEENDDEDENNCTVSRAAILAKFKNLEAEAHKTAIVTKKREFKWSVKEPIKLLKPVGLRVVS